MSTSARSTRPADRAGSFLLIILRFFSPSPSFFRHTGTSSQSGVYAHFLSYTLSYRAPADALFNCSSLSQGCVRLTSQSPSCCSVSLHPPFPLIGLLLERWLFQQVPTPPLQSKLTPQSAFFPLAPNDYLMVRTDLRPPPPPHPLFFLFFFPVTTISTARPFTCANYFSLSLLLSALLFEARCTSLYKSDLTSLPPIRRLSPQ